jgi:hypothetical protein
MRGGLSGSFNSSIFISLFSREKLDQAWVFGSKKFISGSGFGARSLDTLMTSDASSALN